GCRECRRQRRHDTLVLFVLTRIDERRAHRIDRNHVFEARYRSITMEMWCVQPDSGAGTLRSTNWNGTNIQVVELTTIELKTRRFMDGTNTDSEKVEQLTDIFHDITGESSTTEHQHENRWASVSADNSDGNDTIRSIIREM